MDDTRWEALVRRLEPEARANPTAYRRKVLLLAALGYVVIGGLVAILLALAIVVVVVVATGHGVIALKLLIPIGALLWIVARSLYVKFEPPDGVKLERADAPELFRMIDDVRDTIRGPKVHTVLVDSEPNAGVVQIPRAGGLAGSRNYLVLGLPYLAALSPDQLRAVVAHELGHLSRAHGRFGAFVYRVRSTWFKLLEGFERRQSIWTSVARRFFLWYVPYFNAYTFPIMRAHEFEADDAAAHAAGREAAASSLVAGTLAARWLYESYWPELFDAVTNEATPRAAFAPMTHEIAEAKRVDDMQSWYKSLLAIETDVTDTHPSLAERIEHLGVEPEEVLRLATVDERPSAASAYLGEAEPRVVAAVDQAWHAVVAPEWHARHAQAQRDKADLEQLERQQDPLSSEDELRRAQLTETFRDPESALARFRELVGTANDAPGRFAVGRLLLRAEDDEGLRWLDEAMERDPEAVLPACELAHGYLTAHGRDEDAERYRRRAEEQSQAIDAASVERGQVSIEDRLEPPNVPDTWRQHVEETLARHKDVDEAYLVRKRTQYFDETHPFYVLGVLPRSAFRTARKEGKAGAVPLADQVGQDLSLPADVMVVKLSRKSPLGQAFARVEGSRVYARR